jgi:hypothetical protein
VPVEGHHVLEQAVRRRFRFLAAERSGADHQWSLGCPSRNVLEAWETNVVLAKIQIRVDQVKLDPTSAYQHPKTAFPGTVVPYREGGKKIIDMAKICIQLFGDKAYADLAFPGVSVPADLAKELFYGS